MKKNLQLWILLALPFFAFSQNTTKTEYLYMTKGLEIQLNSGLDDKKGYSTEVIGKIEEGSWIRRPEDLVTVNNNSDADVYTTATYWCITTLTTVGYGDVKGYTPLEYIFTMFVEFLGMGVFSYLMNSINSLFDQEIKLTHIIDDRNDKLEKWLS